MTPSIRYATASDGAHVAFATVGEGVPIVCMPPLPFSHIEAGWQLEGVRRWYEALAERAQVVLYDARGCGLSDREGARFTLDEVAGDLGAVVDRLELETFALCGLFNSAPAAIQFSAQHPQRVSELVLWGGFARGLDVYALPLQTGASEVVEANWELLLDGAVRVWTGLSGVEAQQTASLFREAVAPLTALTAFGAARDYDVRGALAKVEARTLVLQRRDSTAQRVSVARDLAAGIPDADLALLPGIEASPFSGDIEGGVAAIERFLGLREAGAEADIGPSAATPLMSPGDASGAVAGPQLTEREAEVLTLLCRGRSNKELASDLGLSVHTVERHLTNLYSKIGLHSRTEAVAFGLRHGYR